MNSEDRSRLAHIWIETALGEHASVAAFARFVLHLLSLGTPPDLLLDAIQAMEDEVHHARLCFGIARQFADNAPGPGRMDLSGVFDQGDDPGSILRAAIIEGCFEETISAAYVQRALDRVQEPGIRAALVRIADDEAKHADLAWRFVNWMLQTYPDLRPTAEECFTQALANPAAIDQKNDWEFLEEYGHLRPSSKLLVRQTTLEEIIIPRVIELFGPALTSSPPEVML